MVRSVLRAIEIVNCLANDISTLTEISKSCDLNVSTTHRLLKVLESKDLVYQDPRTKKYFLGYFFTRLSMNPIASHTFLIRVAEEEVTRLSKLDVSEVGVYVHLGNNNKMARVLDISNTDYFMKILNESIASIALSGCTAEVLLSQYTDAEVASLLKDVDIKPLTEYTIVDPSQLALRVKEVRKIGYSCTFGQRIVGALGIAVPINNYLCPAAITLMGTEFSLKPRIPEMLRELQTSAQRISDNLKDSIQ